MNMATGFYQAARESSGCNAILSFYIISSLSWSLHGQCIHKYEKKLSNELMTDSAAISLMLSHPPLNSENLQRKFASIAGFLLLNCPTGLEFWGYLPLVASICLNIFFASFVVSVLVATLTTYHFFERF